MANRSHRPLLVLDDPVVVVVVVVVVVIVEINLVFRAKLVPMCAVKLSEETHF